MTIRIARILCPIDFSDCGRRALDQAVALAKWYGSALAVLYVHRLTTPVFAAAPGVAPAALQPITLTTEERDHLVRAVDEYVEADRATGVRIATMVDESFDVPGAIVSNARALGADLITIGTHGRSGFTRLVLGSVAERVLRTASCPVLTVPPHVEGLASRPPVAYPRILCPVDFSETCARALQYAASLAAEAEARITVLHVVDLPQDADPLHPNLAAYRKACFDDARTQLAELLAGIGDQKTSPLILAGKPYQEILRVAAEQQSDLIVIGVRGRGAVDLAFFGSTTAQVVRQAACPVLTVRT